MHTIKKLFINTLIIYTALWFCFVYIEKVDATVQTSTTVTTVVSQRLISSQYDSDVYKVKNVRLPSSFKPVVYKHGDVSWLPTMAADAGWPKKTWNTLAKIILRESGGCPNRRGGDAVDKHCNITHVTEWNHRSDTGLLQINGVNYDLSRNKWAAICTQMNICTQEPLLDPLTNLKAGYLLYQISGWGPWDPCTWGPKQSKRCESSKEFFKD